MKFDICLMNPPYASKLHEKFLMKVLDISERGVSIQPAIWINKANRNRNTFKNIINKCQGRISDIEIIPHAEMNNYQKMAICLIVYAVVVLLIYTNLLMV